MANDLGVSPLKLQETANMLRDKKTVMQNTLGNISNSIRDLEASWQSDASRNLKDIASRMSDKFTKLAKEVESFEVFLDQVIANYKEAERQASSITDSIYNAFNP